MRKLLWRLVKDWLLDWLEERALRLPVAKRIEFANRLNVEPEQIERYESLFREWLLEQVRSYRP